MRITLLANAGLYIEIEDKRFLLDAIHYDEEYVFSRLPKNLCWDMLHGVGKYANVENILLSHFHPDHFTQKELISYINNNNVREFFSSEKINKRSELIKCLKENNVSCNIIEKQGKKNFKIGNVDVSAFYTPHLGEIYKDVINICYILKGEDKSVLFIADGDYQEEFFIDNLANENINAVFVTPIFFNNKKGRAILENIIRAEKTVIYHIPFEEDDKKHYYQIALRDSKRFNEQIKNTEILHLKEQLIVI